MENKTIFNHFLYSDLKEADLPEFAWTKVVPELLRKWPKPGEKLQVLMPRLTGKSSLVRAILSSLMFHEHSYHFRGSTSRGYLYKRWLGKKDKVEYVIIDDHLWFPKGSLEEELKTYPDAAVIAIGSPAADKPDWSTLTFQWPHQHPVDPKEDTVIALDGLDPE